jgi:hypothetical protein
MPDYLPTNIENGNYNDLKFNLYDTLVQSTDLKSKLTAEKQRLMSKKVAVDEMYQTYSRQQYFANIATSKNNAYFRIFIASVILAIAHILLFLSRNYIPEWLFTILLISLISGSIILMYVMITNVIQRDPVNIDQIDSDSPLLKNKSTQKKYENDLKLGKITAALTSQCQGNECCTDGSFNFTTNRCEGFTSRSELPCSPYP